MTLTHKQKMFVEEYLQGWSAAEAARKAGYSERSAPSIGPENLKKPEIAALIKQRVSDKAMTTDEWLVAIAEIARGDIGKFLDIESMSFDINLQKAKEAGLTNLIKSVKQRTTISGKDDTETHVQEIELYSRLEALEKIGKHLGLLTDKHDVDMKIVMEQNVLDLLNKVWSAGNSGA